MTKPLLRDERGRLMPGGPSLNPSGRRPMPADVREAIAANGRKAVERMAGILGDDQAFGPGAWMPPRDQVRLLEIAIERGFGKAPVAAADQAPNDDVSGHAIRELLDRVASELDPPERRNALSASTARLEPPPGK